MPGSRTGQQTQYLQVWKLEMCSFVVPEHNQICLCTVIYSQGQVLKWPRNLSLLLASHYLQRYPGLHHFARFIQLNVLPYAAITELYNCHKKKKPVFIKNLGAHLLWETIREAPVWLLAGKDIWPLCVERDLCHKYWLTWMKLSETAQAKMWFIKLNCSKTVHSQALINEY